MMPPELRKVLVSIAGSRPPGRIELSPALVGYWTQGELLMFGFRRKPDGRWLAPLGWQSA